MTVTARRNRLLVAVLVALTMTAGIFGAAVLTARVAQAQPVYLEPAQAPGADPFVPSLLQPADGVAPVPEMAGTGDQATCDPATLTAYLEGHPDAAAAWVKALDADPGLSWSGGNKVAVEQISAYVAELTPAVLGGDMQVTNHRFVDGQLAAVQSVLQEGTAVLVDADGTPRVRCACGNPLTPAADSDDDSSGTEYVGEPWDGFSYDEATDEAGDEDSDDQKASADDADHEDHPVVSCGRGEYRDGDHCVRKCPRGTYRDDDGRCRAPIDECDRAKHDWCKPRPVCTPPQQAHGHESVAPATDRHGPPCRPKCSDDRSGAAAKHCPPPCPSATAGAADRKHCTPPVPLPCPTGKACQGEQPTCPVPGTDAVAGKKVDPCAGLPGSGSEGKPNVEAEGPGSTPPGGATEPVVTLPSLTGRGTEGGADAGTAPALPVPSAPVDPSTAAPAPGAGLPVPLPVPLPAQVPPVGTPPGNTGSTPPVTEGGPDPAVRSKAPAAPPAPVETKPAAPAPVAKQVVPPVVKKVVPPVVTSIVPPAAKPAPPVAKSTPAATKPPAAAKPAPTVAKAPAKAVVRCPSGTAMPAAGCTIPATGVPVGWVQRGTTMVPA